MHRGGPFDRYLGLLAISLATHRAVIAGVDEPVRLDQATRAIRQEAENTRKRREAIFLKLKALPQAQGRVVPRAILLWRQEKAEPEPVFVVAHRRVDDDRLKPVDGPEKEEPEENVAPAERILVPQGTFDRWLFGSTGSHERLDKWMESLLTQRIKDEGKTHKLTLAEQRKLRLAGHGDIKRLKEQVDNGRRSFELASMDRDRLRRFLRDHQSLRQSIRSGPFNAESLLAKSLRKMVAERAAPATSK